MKFDAEKSRFEKKVVAAILIISISLSLWGVSLSEAFAVKAGDTGVVDSDVGLYLRTGPGTTYDDIALLSDKEVVEILDTAKDSDGDTWYKVKVKNTGQEGYCFGEYIKITSYTYNEDFEKYMDEQGFPESYKPYLRNLHSAHPKWIFKSQKTNLNWKTVIDKEAVLGRSLVESNCLDSWKSTDYGAFDPAKSQYTVYDSGGWVAASRPIIEFYVDPRNYLNDGKIFAFLDNKYDGSTQNIDGLNSILSGTFMDKAKKFPESGYATYGDLLMKVGSKTDVSPYVLASMIIIEQGRTGSSGSISGTNSKYPGIYNFFNVGAYKTSTMSAIERGLWYASQSGSYERPWNSRAKSILGGAEIYSENYVQSNKNTLYLKRFNVMNGSSAVGTMQYMTSIYGAYVESSQLREGYDTLLDNAFEFSIPIYDNMPEKACIKPTSSGDNNYYLKSLSVAGYSLTPVFNTYKETYELVVDSNTSSVDVSATPYGSKAKVSGIGNIKLTEKDTTVSVKVTAASGYTKTYKLYISKADAPSGKPSISSSVYSFGTYVTGITEKTSISSFKKNINVTDGSIRVLDVAGKDVTSGNVGTGMNVELLDTAGKKVSAYSVCVKGDTSGDGIINSLDSLQIQKHIVGIKSLTDVRLKAADVSGDGRVNSLDVLKVEKHIVGIAAIK